MAKIVRNPKILLGKPTIEGTRISVELILNLLGQGMSVNEILKGYPHLTPEDIKAVIEYAGKAVKRIYPAKTAIAHEISNRRKS